MARELTARRPSSEKVSVPVRLYAATEDPRPRMHQVHAADGSRIRHRRVCEAEACEVSEAEIGRGWEAPDGPVAQRPYALLVEALARTGRVGIATFAVRTRERLAVLRPRRGVLVVHALRWPQELREPGDLASPAPVTERELELAEVLIGQLAGVDITALHDEYGAALEQVVTAKLEGSAWAEPPEPQPVIDLMQALEDSVRQARHRYVDQNHP
ncbi:Ku protein [Streptomyces sp. NPDC059373]